MIHVFLVRTGDILITARLEKVFTEVLKLSQKEQDVLADWLLAELESERRWDKRFADSQEEFSKLASEAVAEHRRSQTQELDPDKL